MKKIEFRNLVTADIRFVALSGSELILTLNGEVMVKVIPAKRPVLWPVAPHTDIEWKVCHKCHRQVPMRYELFKRMLCKSCLKLEWPDGRN